MTWRDLARPIIADAIRTCDYPRGCDLRIMRRVLRAVYPFGERRYWPYRVWLDEVRRQLRRAEGRADLGPSLEQLPLFAERLSDR